LRTPLLLLNKISQRNFMKKRLVDRKSILKAQLEIVLTMIDDIKTNKQFKDEAIKALEIILTQTKD
jgi:hypothetical protein